MKIINNLKFVRSYFEDVIRAPSRVCNLEKSLKVEMNKSRLESTDYSELKPISVAKNVIVSLTTYGSNIHNVHFVVKSLLCQTIQADKIILWLDEREFDEKSVPLNLSCLIGDEFIIQYCENLKSYKKIMPTIQNYPDYDVITVDDDYLYPRDLVELLLKEQNQHPRVIIGHRAHTIKTTNRGGICKYNSWDFESLNSESSHSVFVTSGGGTLFPKGILGSGFLEKSDYMTLCPSADDVWINFYAMKHGIKRKKVSDTRGWSNRFLSIDTEGSTPLSFANVARGENDRQIDNIIDKFSIDISDLINSVA